eukprot:Nk52_evm10s322 gene=Nk52_evmTU10s322
MLPELTVSTSIFINKCTDVRDLSIAWMENEYAIRITMFGETFATQFAPVTHNGELKSQYPHNGFDYRMLCWHAKAKAPEDSSSRIDFPAATALFNDYVYPAKKTFHNCRDIRELKERLFAEVVIIELIESSRRKQEKKSRREIISRYKVPANRFFYPNGEFDIEATVKVKRSLNLGKRPQTGKLWFSTFISVEDTSSYIPYLEDKMIQITREGAEAFIPFRWPPQHMRKHFDVDSFDAKRDEGKDIEYNDYEIENDSIISPLSNQPASPKMHSSTRPLNTSSSRPKSPQDEYSTYCSQNISHIMTKSKIKNSIGYDGNYVIVRDALGNKRLLRNQCKKVEKPAPFIVSKKPINDHTKDYEYFYKAQYEREYAKYFKS